MYALHNANLVRKAIPRELTAPKPLYANRKAHHDKIATTLRVSQTAKRVITQAKRKATLDAKKAKKLTEQGGLLDSSDGEAEDSGEDDNGDMDIVEVQASQRGRKRRRKE